MTLVVRTTYPVFSRSFRYPDALMPRRAWFRSAETEPWRPAISVSNEEGQIAFHVELPEVKAEDIDVTASEGMITFKAKKQHERKTERAGYEFSETSTSSFRQSIPLPAGSLWEKAEASFSDGMLEVRIPRSAPEEPRRIRVATPSGPAEDEPGKPPLEAESRPAGTPEPETEDVPPAA